MLRSAAAILLSALGPLAAACGAERVDPPDPSRPYFTQAPSERSFPEAGVRFRAPADLPFPRGEEPLVTSTSTGSATVALWRYPRTEPLPRDDAALDEAEQALVGAARTRDTGFKLERTRRVRVDGAPGIELVGTETVAGRPRRVRSTHVYAKGAEYVVDAFASPRDFPLVDRTVFRPLVRSLKIDPPRP